MHETNSFNPKPTCVEDFVVTRGSDLLDDPGVAPFVNQGISIVAGLMAEAIPSGPVERETYDYFKGSLLRAIEDGGRFDGVCLFLHGAMVVEGVGDGENDLVSSVRGLVGPDVPISVSLDLHGNISPELADYANILVAYRTAPHVDKEETRKQAFGLLVDAIRGGYLPRTVVQKVPVMIAGDPAITSQKPASDLYALLPEIDKKEGILAASLMIGYSWNDTPSIGSSILITATDEQYLETAKSEAAELAAVYWGVRKDFHFTVPTGTIDETIGMAQACDEKPVFISDSGDNVTSGAAGDVPVFLERLIALDTQDVVLAGIQDPAAVEKCRAAGVGEKVQLEIGGKLDTINGRPLSVGGAVVTLTDGGAVVRIDGVDVILTSRRTSFTTIDGFNAFGIDPPQRSVIVVKLGYLFPELKAAAAKSFVAMSSGFASQKLDLPYKHIPRPIFPLDSEMIWGP
jgi:microcystin degradation protein MlrC